MAVVAGAGVFYLANLEKSPLTGRNQFIVNYSIFDPTSLAESTFKEYEHKLLPVSHPKTKRVRHIAARLIDAYESSDWAEKIESKKKLTGNWKVFVVNDPLTKNAFVLPSGDIYVFSGLLDQLKAGDDAFIATILAHEILHRLLRHSEEKAAILFLVAVLVDIVKISLGWDIPLDIFSQFAFALPFSRKLECEADKYGLFLMARACYNPAIAPQVWMAMSSQDDSSFVSTLISTHPSNSDRIAALTQLVPEALTHASECKRLLPP